MTERTHSSITSGRTAGWVFLRLTFGFGILVRGFRLRSSIHASTSAKSHTMQWGVKLKQRGNSLRRTILQIFASARGAICRSFFCDGWSDGREGVGFRKLRRCLVHFRFTHRVLVGVFYATRLILIAIMVLMLS